jgi:hypothetical protein
MYYLCSGEIGTFAKNGFRPPTQIGANEQKKEDVKLFIIQKLWLSRKKIY